MNSVSGAWAFLTLLTAGSGMIYVLRWFWWRINAYTEITALVLGLIAGTANLFISDSIVMFGKPWSKISFEIKLALFTAIILPACLIITYLTPAVSKDKLEVFYRKTRPGGFWGILSKETRSLPGKTLSWKTLVDVFGGILLCYGSSLLIGYAILLQFKQAAACMILTLCGAIIVYRWYQKEIKEVQLL